MIPLRDNLESERIPFLTYALLALNVVAFGLELVAMPQPGVVADAGGGRQLLLQTGFEQMIWTFGLRPAELLDPSLALAPLTPLPEAATLLTSMFLHGGWLHLGGNMLFLWVFADNIEDALGHVRFLLFYLLGGLAAAGLQIAVEPASQVPMVGASGAIAAVLGAYLMLYPRARVLTLVPIFVFIRLVEIPALFFLGLWFLFQLLGAPGGGGTAWFAHIGGFVFGLFAVHLFRSRKRPPPSVRHHPRARSLFSDEL
ncbi:MAG: rhomboid family intramembrane serine protease [Deltaproteobacteria bacterium]|nr:rhomboid family intramembrane serine protease [Deltaproteobacteria bacterium]